MLPQHARQHGNQMTCACHLMLKPHSEACREYAQVSEEDPGSSVTRSAQGSLLAVRDVSR